MNWCKKSDQHILLTWFSSLTCDNYWRTAFSHWCISSHITTILCIWVESSQCSSQCCPIQYRSNGGHIWSNHLLWICLISRSVAVHRVTSDNTIPRYGYRPTSRQLSWRTSNRRQREALRWWWNYKWRKYKQRCMNKIRLLKCPLKDTDQVSEGNTLVLSKPSQLSISKLDHIYLPDWKVCTLSTTEGLPSPTDVLAVT